MFVGPDQRGLTSCNSDDMCVRSKQAVSPSPFASLAALELPAISKEGRMHSPNADRPILLTYHNT